MQMKNKVITLLILSCFSGAGCSASEPARQSPEQPQQMKSISEEIADSVLTNGKETGQDKEKSVAEQLAKIKADVVLINAEAARAEARKKLEQVTGQKKNRDGESEGLPQLKSIYGNGDNQLKAEFKYDTGDTVEARVGTILPGRFKVTAITATSAHVQDVSGNSHVINMQHIQERERDNRVTEGVFSSDIPAPRLR